MSVLIRFSPPSMTAEQYDSIVARLYEEGIHPAPGLEIEVCFGSGDQMKVSLLFDSKEHLETFGARLQPILAVLIAFNIPVCHMEHPHKRLQLLKS